MTAQPALLEPPPAPTSDAGEITVSGSTFRLALRVFASNRLAIVGVGILVFFVLFSFVGPLLYHSNQLRTNLSGVDLPPGAGHPLGTDPLGFDELGRLMLGGQASLEVGFFAATLATVIGTLWGAVAGLAGGIVDAAMMRVVDVILSIPLLFVLLIISTSITPTVLSTSIIIGLFAWLVPARLVRGEVLSLRVRDYVASARVMGASRWRVISRHLIPNALGVVVVNITFQVADAILIVATLGFLGFGLSYPIADWGDMLSNGINYLYDGYWWLIYPVGVSLILVVMACNFIGDALRDAFDARLRGR